MDQRDAQDPALPHNEWILYAMLGSLAVIVFCYLVYREIRITWYEWANREYVFVPPSPKPRAPESEADMDGDRIATFVYFLRRSREFRVVITRDSVQSERDAPLPVRPEDIHLTDSSGRAFAVREQVHGGDRVLRRGVEYAFDAGHVTEHRRFGSRERHYHLKLAVTYVLNGEQAIEAAELHPRRYWRPGGCAGDFTMPLRWLGGWVLLIVSPLVGLPLLLKAHESRRRQKALRQGHGG